MIFVYVPCQSLDAAKTIAKLLVENRMAGSVDIMPTQSVYRGNEGVAEISGAVIIVKTIDKHVQVIS